MWKSFLEENPGCSYEDLVSAFGSPEMFAKEMLSTLDQEKLAKSRTGQKWLLCSIAALTMTLMITAAFWFAGQAESKPAPDKDEQIPNISIITDDDSENPIVFSFGFSPDESKGYFYWNQHESEDNEP